MDKIKFSTGRNKYWTINMKRIDSIEPDNTSTFIRFTSYDMQKRGFFIGDRGTYVKHNNIKYRTPVDFHRLAVVLEKEKVYNALTKLDS